MSEFSIKTDKVKVTAQEFVDISRELDIIKSQCEDVMNSLALPDGAGVSIRAGMAKGISELEEGKVNTIIYGDSLYDIATIYEETEKRVVEYP